MAHGHMGKGCGGRGWAPYLIYTQIPLQSGSQVHQQGHRPLHCTYRCTPRGETGTQ